MKMLYMHKITRRSNKMRSSKQSCLQNIYKPTKVRNSNDHESYVTFSSASVYIMILDELRQKDSKTKRQKDRKTD